MLYRAGRRDRPLCERLIRGYVLTARGPWLPDQSTKDYADSNDVSFKRNTFFARDLGVGSAAVASCGGVAGHN
jgi:hypothetical protein